MALDFPIAASFSWQQPICGESHCGEMYKWMAFPSVVVRHHHDVFLLWTDVTLGESQMLLHYGICRNCRIPIRIGYNPLKNYADF